MKSLFPPLIFLQGMKTLVKLKHRCKRPIGVYLGCPKAGFEAEDQKALYRREGMLCTPEHIQKCVDMGVFIVLGGNPGSEVINYATDTSERFNYPIAGEAVADFITSCLEWKIRFVCPGFFQMLSISVTCWKFACWLIK